VCVCDVCVVMCGWVGVWCVMYVCGLVWCVCVCVVWCVCVMYVFGVVCVCVVCVCGVCVCVWCLCVVCVVCVWCVYVVWCVCVFLCVLCGGVCGRISNIHIRLVFPLNYVRILINLHQFYPASSA